MVDHQLTKIKTWRDPRVKKSFVLFPQALSSLSLAALLHFSPLKADD